MNFRKSICFFFYVTFLVTAEDTWSVKKKLHKGKTLRSERIKKLADQGDQSYFKNTLLKPMLRVRVPDTDGNRFVQQHIKNHMTNYGWSIEEDSFTDMTPAGEKKFTNIIATQNTLASRKLVIACHHDSKLFKKFEFIGAIDSAVPCAMMLDLAKNMNSVLSKEDPMKAQDLTLQFIFFDGEEAFDRWTSTDSTYGSRHLAEKMATTMVQVGKETRVEEIKTLDVIILLDLIGTKDVTFKNWFPETERLFERLQKIEKKMVRSNLLETNSQSHRPYFAGSLVRHSGIEDDHIPFLKRGVPILHLISSPFPPVWHKEGDNEKALDFPTIDNLNKILRVFVAEYLHLSP